MSQPVFTSCLPGVRALWRGASLPAALLLAAAAPAPAQPRPAVVPPHEHLPMAQEAAVTQGLLALK
jgi:hypothetical protein